MSTTAWIYLGTALLQLDEMAQAEEAISQANILDPTNPIPWGLSCILALKFADKRL